MKKVLAIFTLSFFLGAAVSSCGANRTEESTNETSSLPTVISTDIDSV